MALTLLEISKIHSQRLATENKKYYADDGKIYIGTKERRLRLLDKAEILPFNKTQDISSETIQKAIEEIDSKIKVVTNNYVTEEELLAAEERSRCFALAMSIIL